MFVNYCSTNFELTINKLNEYDDNEDLTDLERELLKRIKKIFNKNNFLLMKNEDDGESFFHFLDRSLKIYHSRRDRDSLNGNLGSWLSGNKRLEREGIQAFSTMLALDIAEIKIRELKFLSGFLGEFINFHYFVLDNFYKFSDYCETYLEASFYYIPKTYYYEIFADPAIENLKVLVDGGENSQNIINDNIKKLNEELIPQINHLQETINKSANLQNFVELNKAFEKLFDEKKNGKKYLEKNVLFYKRLLFAIPSIELILMAILLACEVSFTEGGRWLLVVVPAITLVLVSVYYLKIALHDLKTIELQIFDLETRMALCTFIDSYANKANELKTDKNISGLILFESMIFSSISQSKDPSPNIFDGADQLAKLIEAMKQK